MGNAETYQVREAWHPFYGPPVLVGQENGKVVVEKTESLPLTTVTAEGEFFATHPNAPVLPAAIDGHAALTSPCQVGARGSGLTRRPTHKASEGFEANDRASGRTSMKREHTDVLGIEADAGDMEFCADYPRSPPAQSLLCSTSGANRLPFPEQDSGDSTEKLRQGLPRENTVISVGHETSV